MGPHNRAAMESLGSTGRLPQDHFWGAMRGRHEANSARFEAGHPVMGALLRRDLAQRMGKADGRTSLFPGTPLWAHLRGRHDSHTARFDRYHPFLGKLFKLELPQESGAGTPPAGLVVGPDASGLASPLTASDVPIPSGAPIFDVPIPSGAPIFDVPVSSGAPIFDVPIPSGAPIFLAPIPREDVSTNSQEAPHAAVSPVPEPSGITLAGLGMVIVCLAGARSWWPRTG